MGTNKTQESATAYLNKEFFENALQKSIHSSGVTVENLYISRGCDNGDNYSSIVYRVRVEYKNLNGKMDEVTWIVKSMPFDPTRELLKDMFLFKKEKDMYFDLIPKMEECMNTVFAPRCYYATSEPEDTLIIQDLQSIGYKLVNRNVTLDEAHCAVVLRKLGKFHAASIYLGEKNPDAFNHYEKGIFNKVHLEHPQMIEFFLSSYRATVRLVSEWPNFKDIAKKMEKLESSYLEKTCTIFESKDALFKVLNHGDLWSNNIFFKYDTEDDNIPVDTLFIDFQGSIYTSPAIDLIYFLNISTQLGVLQKKRDYVLKEYYYESLRTSCEMLNVRKIPSYEELQEEIDKKEFFGLFAAIGSSLICMGKESTEVMTMEKVLDNVTGEMYRDIACRDEKFQAKMRYLLRRADGLKLLD